jgi:hypothetical protein
MKQYKKRFFGKQRKLTLPHLEVGVGGGVGGLGFTADQQVQQINQAGTLQTNNAVNTATVQGQTFNQLDANNFRLGAATQGINNGLGIYDVASGIAPTKFLGAGGGGGGGGTPTGGQ